MEENIKPEEIDKAQFNKNLRHMYFTNKVDPGFYQLCIEKIKKYLKSRFGNQLPLEETARDVFHIKIYDIKTLPVVVAPESWLKKVTRNYVLDEMKNNPVFIRLIENIEYEPYYEDRIEKVDVINALKHLNKNQKQVIALYYFHDIGYINIAKILKLEYANVRKIAQRAREILKKYLE